MEEYEHRYMMIDRYDHAQLFTSYGEAELVSEFDQENGPHEIAPVTVIDGHVTVVKSGNVFAIAKHREKVTTDDERVIFECDLNADVYAACSQMARHVGYSGVSELIEKTLMGRFRLSANLPRN